MCHDGHFGMMENAYGWRDVNLVTHDYEGLDGQWTQHGRKWRIKVSKFQLKVLKIV